MLIFRLQDADYKVRKTAFYVLANLILRDYLRVKSQVSFMAQMLIAEEEELKDMCKTFFAELALKGLQLYNILPNIFSKLLTDGVKENDVQTIMQYYYYRFGTFQN